MQKVIALICGLALVVGLAACGGSDSSSSSSGSETGSTRSGAETAANAEGEKEAGGNSGKEAHLAFFAPLPNGFIEAAIEGVEAGAGEAGGKVDQVFSAEGDLTQASNQITDAVSSGKYDGLVIYPLAPQIMPAVEAAIKAGVKVGIVESTLNPKNLLENYVPPGAVISSVEPLQERVEGMDEMTEEACEGIDPCEVGFIMGIQQNPQDVAIFEGFKQGLAGKSNIEVVASGQGMYEVDAARTAAQDMISGHSGIDVIVANADIMAEGVALAGKAAGNTEIKIIGAGASEKGCKAVEAGEWFGTTNSVPKDAGEVAGKAVSEAVTEGAKFPTPEYNPLEESGLPLTATKEDAKECPAQWTY